MIEALRVIGWAEWRMLVQRIAAIRTSPSRALVWLFYIGYIVFIGWVRTRGTHHASGNWFTPQIEDEAVAAFIALVALSLFNVGGKRVGVFASRAEARTIVGSPLDPRWAVLTLQLRTVLFGSLRIVISLAFALVIIVPNGFGPGALARLILVLLVALLAYATLPLPVALAPASTRPFLGILGALALGVAAISAAEALALQFHFALPATLPPIRLGAPLAAVLAGDVVPFVVLIALGAALGALVYVMAGDAYPEIYELSLANIEMRDRLAAAGGSGLIARWQARRGERIGAVRTAGGEARFVPAGVAALIWKEWVTAKRGSALVSRLATFFGWTVAAIAFVLLARTGKGAVVGGLIGGLSQIVILGIALSALNLRDDLARPIWWTASAPMPLRLAVWAFATTWQTALGMVIAFAVYAVFAPAPMAFAVGAPLAIVTIWLLRTTGILLYALFPNTVDQRGPVAMIRLFLVYLAIVIPLGIGVVVVLLQSGGPEHLTHPRAALLEIVAIAAPFALVEGGLALAAGGWLIENRVERFTSAALTA